MPRYLVTAYDRIVRHLEKEFEADNEAAAREIADQEEIGEDTGWTERYEELFSECYIANVELLDNEGEES